MGYFARTMAQAEAADAVDDSADEDGSRPAYAVDGAPSTQAQDTIKYLEVFAAKIDALLASSQQDNAQECPVTEFMELQEMPGHLGQDSFVKALRQAADLTLAIRTGSEPLKLCKPAFWVVQCPDLFCYGDGAWPESTCQDELPPVGANACASHGAGLSQKVRRRGQLSFGSRRFARRTRQV